MLGAIIGDIVGSRFEFASFKSKDFELFTRECDYTDDSIMTIAVALAIAKSRNDFKALSENAVKCMRAFGRHYPNPCGGYGGSFAAWISMKNPKPYNSFGNGAAMRVSACGLAAKSLAQVKSFSKAVTEVTHNHPEGIKGAEAVSVAIYLAKRGKSKEKIKQYINEHYYKIDFTLDEIRDSYGFDESCQGTVPQALAAFFESTDFEDAIRNAISLGGDSDTLAAITGSVAEAYYGIPDKIKSIALTYLDDDLKTRLYETQRIIYAKGNY